jgi:hypothetical protein
MLRKLRTTDPAFWDELIKKAPSDSVLPPLAGAELESDDYIYPPFKDNSDLSCDIIIAKVFGSEIDRVEAIIDGDLVDGNAINNASDDQLGHGKRTRKENKLYNRKSFWWHGNEDASDKEKYN